MKIYTSRIEHNVLIFVKNHFQNRNTLSRNLCYDPHENLAKKLANFRLFHDFKPILIENKKIQS